jgi:hypothetical protein
MLKQLTVLAVVLSVFAVAGNAFADGPPYGWSISASPTDPFLNQTNFVAGVYTAYLWFACSAPVPGGPGGMAAAEFGLCSSQGANVILAFTPMNGYLNAGTATNLLLAVGGCPTGPMNAGSILMLNNAPGQLLLCPAVNGNMVTVDCSGTPQTWGIEWIGLDMGTGDDPRGEGEVTCTKPVSVEESSWGTIKSLYR